MNLRFACKRIASHQRSPSASRAHATGDSEGGGHSLGFRHAVVKQALMKMTEDFLGLVIKADLFIILETCVLLTALSHSVSCFGVCVSP